MIKLLSRKPTALRLVNPSAAENLPRFAWSTPQRQKLKFLPLRRYNLTLNLRSEERRVGKECRSRGTQSDEKKKNIDTERVLVQKPTLITLEKTTPVMKAKRR